MPSLSPSRRVTPHSVKNLFASAPSVICPHFVLDPQYEGNVEVLVTVSFQVVDDASVLPEPTTNNRMELQAVIEALSWAEKEGHSKILLIFDSQYVVKIANVWRHGSNLSSVLFSQSLLAQTPQENIEALEQSLMEALDIVNSELPGQQGDMEDLINVLGDPSVAHTFSELRIQMVGLVDLMRPGQLSSNDLILYEQDSAEFLDDWNSFSGFLEATTNYFRLAECRSRITTFLKSRLGNYQA